MIDILISTNKRFVRHSCVMLSSLFHNNREEEFRVHVFHNSMKEDEIDILTNQVVRYGYEVKFYSIDMSFWEGFPTNKAITIECYNRLLVGKLLDKSIKKVLYLDSDMVITGSINALWNLQMEGKSLIAVPDKIDEEETIFSRVGVEHKYPYFNSGMLIFDLDIMRSINFLPKVFEIVRDYSNLLTMHDQDILNLIFKESVLIADIKWNYIYKKAAQELPVIIHFIGPVKPWHFGARHPYRNQYLNYLKKSIFNDCEPNLNETISQQKKIYYIFYLLHCENVYFFISNKIKKFLRRR